MFPDMPCMKRVYRVPGHALHEKGLQRQIRRRRYIGQQPGTKSASRPADKPVINRWSTAGFVVPSVYLRFALFVLANRGPQPLSLIRQSVRGTVLSWANRPVGVPFCPAPTRPWYVRVLDSTGHFMGHHIMPCHFLSLHIKPFHIL